MKRTNRTITLATRRCGHSFCKVGRKHGRSGLNSE
jgi:hypothetical protein